MTFVYMQCFFVLVNDVLLHKLIFPVLGHGLFPKSI